VTVREQEYLGPAWPRNGNRPADFTGFPDLKRFAEERRAGFYANEFAGELGRRLHESGLDADQIDEIFYWGEDIGWSMVNLHEMVYKNTVHISVIMKAFKVHIKLVGGVSGYSYFWVKDVYNTRGANPPIIALEAAIEEAAVKAAWNKTERRMKHKFHVSHVPKTISRPQEFGQWA
jgi:hypothetical protein